MIHIMVICNWCALPTFLSMYMYNIYIYTVLALIVHVNRHAHPHTLNLVICAHGDFKIPWYSPRIHVHHVGHCCVDPTVANLAHSAVYLRSPDSWLSIWPVLAYSMRLTHWSFAWLGSRWHSQALLANQRPSTPADGLIIVVTSFPSIQWW